MTGARAPLHAAYAVEMSAMHLRAAKLARLSEVAWPGGNPVIEVPGEVPTDPTMTVFPVEVTVWPAQAPKLLAEPMEIAALLETNRSTMVRVLGCILCKIVVSGWLWKDVGNFTRTEKRRGNFCW